jgi:predicted alpha/beta hydrolase family esterase
MLQEEGLDLVCKPQVLILSGGRSFGDREQLLEFYKNYDITRTKGRAWKDWLTWTLEDVYEFIFPDFPTRNNADYEIDKMIFEKYFTKFNDKDLIVIAHSLGTIFIMKYLLENRFVKNIKQLHLVSPIVSNYFQPADDVENTGTFTFDYPQVGELKNFCEGIHIWHSIDDTMCAYKNAEYLKEKIPSAHLHTFSNRGHFLQSTFWELFDVLRASL